jgi:TP901 family phage tail tape measure protein
MSKLGTLYYHVDIDRPSLNNAMSLLNNFVTALSGAQSQLTNTSGVDGLRAGFSTFSEVVATSVQRINELTAALSGVTSAADNADKSLRSLNESSSSASSRTQTTQFQDLRLAASALANEFAILKNNASTMQLTEVNAQMTNLTQRGETLRVAVASLATNFSATSQEGVFLSGVMRDLSGVVSGVRIMEAQQTFSTFDRTIRDSALSVVTLTQEANQLFNRLSSLSSSEAAVALRNVQSAAGNLSSQIAALTTQYAGQSEATVKLAQLQAQLSATVKKTGDELTKVLGRDAKNAFEEVNASAVRLKGRASEVFASGDLGRIASYRAELKALEANLTTAAGLFGKNSREALALGKHAEAVGKILRNLAIREEKIKLEPVAKQMDSLTQRAVRLERSFNSANKAMDTMSPAQYADVLSRLSEQQRRLSTDIDRFAVSANLSDKQLTRLQSTTERTASVGRGLSAALGEMNAKLPGLDGNFFKLQASASAMRGQVSAATNTIRAFGDASGEQVAKLRAIVEQSQAAIKRLETYRAATEGSTKSTKALNDAMGAYARAAAQAQSAINRTTGAHNSMTLAQMLARGATTELTNSLFRLSPSLGIFTQNLSYTSGNLIAFARAAAPLVGIAGSIIAVIATMKASLGAARELETAMARVRKTTDMTNEELSIMTKRFQTLARTIPVSTIEMAEYAAIAGQLGITGVNNVTMFAEAIARLSIATNVVGQQGAENLARFLGALGTSTREMGISAERAGNVLNELENTTASSAGEILKMTQYTQGLSAQADLSMDQILGLNAALISIGLSAEAGGSAIVRIFAKMQTGAVENSKEFAEFARVAGMTAAAFRDLVQESPLEALIQLSKGLGEAKDAGENLNAIISALGVNEVRERRTLLSLANGYETLTSAVKTAREEYFLMTSLTKEVTILSTTLDGKLTTLGNRFTTIKQQIGEELLEPAKALVDGLIAILDNFQYVAIALGAVLVAVGLGVAGAAVGVVGLVAGFVALAGGLGLAAAGFLQARNAARPLQVDMKALNDTLSNHASVVSSIASKADLENYFTGIASRLNGDVKTSWENFASVTLQKTTDSFDSVKASAREAFDEITRIETATARLGLVTGAQKLGGRINDLTSGLRSLGNESGGLLGGFAAVGEMLKDTMDVSQVTAFANEMDALIVRLDQMGADRPGQNIFASMRADAALAKQTADDLINVLNAANQVSTSIANRRPTPPPSPVVSPTGSAATAVKNPVEEIMKTLDRSRAELYARLVDLGIDNAQAYNEGLVNAMRNATTGLIRVFTDPFESEAFRRQAREAFDGVFGDLDHVDQNLRSHTMRGLLAGLTDAVAEAELQMSTLGRNADISGLRQFTQNAMATVAGFLSQATSEAEVALIRETYEQLEYWILRFDVTAANVTATDMLRELSDTLANIDARRAIDQTYSLAEATRDQAAAYRAVINAALDVNAQKDPAIKAEEIIQLIEEEQRLLAVAASLDAVESAYSDAQKARADISLKLGRLITQEQAYQQLVDTEIDLLIALAEQLGWNNEEVAEQERRVNEVTDSYYDYVAALSDFNAENERSALLTRDSAEEARRLVNIIARNEDSVYGVAAAFERLGKTMTPEILAEVALRFNTTTDAITRLLSGAKDFDDLSANLAARLRVGLISETDVLRAKVGFLGERLVFLNQNFEDNREEIESTLATYNELKAGLDEDVIRPLDAAAKKYSDAVELIRERTEAGLVNALEEASGAVSAKRQQVEDLVLALMALRAAEGDNTEAIEDYVAAIEAARVSLAALTQEEVRRRLAASREATGIADDQMRIEVAEGLMTEEQRLTNLLRLRNDELRLAATLSGEEREAAMQSAREQIASLDAQLRRERALLDADSERIRRVVDAERVAAGLITQEAELEARVRRRTSLLEQLYEKQARGEDVSGLIAHQLMLRDREEAQLRRSVALREYATQVAANESRASTDAALLKQELITEEQRLNSAISRNMGLVETAIGLFGEESEEVKVLVDAIRLLREELDNLPESQEKAYLKAKEAADKIKPIDFTVSDLLGLSQSDLNKLFQDDISVLQTQLESALAAFGEGSTQAAQAALDLTAKETELANAKEALAKLWWAQVSESNSFLQNLVGIVASAAIAQSKIAGIVMSGVTLEKDDEGKLTGGIALDPMMMLVNAIMKVVEGSEAFKDIMQTIDGLLDPIISMVDALLNAIKPIIQVAVELVNAALQPLVAIIEQIVAPALNFIANIVKNVWNAIVRFLKSINIFGFQPFKNLKEIGDNGASDEGLIERQERLLAEARERMRTAKTVEEIRRAQQEIEEIEKELARLRGEDKKGKDTKGTRVSEITGPTRDLLLDLFRPLSILPSWTELFRDIRNDVRAIASGVTVPQLPSVGFGVAGAAGDSVAASSGSVVYNFNNVSITTNATNVRDLAREIGRVANVDRRGGK